MLRIELSNKFKTTQYKAMSAVRIYCTTWNLEYCTTWNWPKLSASSTSFTFWLASYSKLYGGLPTGAGGVGGWV